MSQFAPDQIFVSDMVAGCTTIQRLNENIQVRDLLDEYAVGSLYMSGLIAPQGPVQPAPEASGHGK